MDGALYIKTFIFGNVPIELWEYPVFILLLVAILVISGRIKRRNIDGNPAYRFFLWGLWAKVLGGLIFGMIYVFFYRTGDTTSYYECALAHCNMFTHDLGDFFTTYFGGGTIEIKSIFNAKTGTPMWYMMSNDNARIVYKILVPFQLLGLKSYFLTTVLVSVFTYGGLWRLYLMFTRYFPGMERNLAIAILFMPSVIFWGSGILKDSFTLAATCYFIDATNNLITHRKRRLPTILMLLISGYLIVLIKPYILLILFPGTLVWMSYSRIQQIKNAFFRYVFVPFIYAFIIGGSYFVLTSLGDRLGKFSLDNALETAVVTQHDLKQDYYDGNSFDIGDMEPTLPGVLSKFPVATFAGLYRPMLGESAQPLMLVAGLENLFIFVVTLMALLSLRRGLLFRLIAKEPVLLYSLVFALMFAFMIGVTTSNFGALVRFKIPLIPLYMAVMMVIIGHLRIANERRKSSIIQPASESVIRPDQIEK